MSAAARHLHLVDEHGEVVPSAELEKLQAEVTKLRGDFKNAQNDVKTKNRTIAELRRDKIRERLDYERYADVQRIATYWHRKCRPNDYAKAGRRVNPMAPDRFDAVRGILDQKKIEIVDGRRQYVEMYSLEDCRAAIDGATFDHFVKKRKNGSDQHFDDLELIFRDASHFEEFRARSPKPPAVLASRSVECDTAREGSKQPPPSAARSEVQDGSEQSRHGRALRSWPVPGRDWGVRRLGRENGPPSP